jgi:hypothetical protein
MANKKFEVFVRRCRADARGRDAIERQPPARNDHQPEPNLRLSHDSNMMAAYMPPIDP